MRILRCVILAVVRMSSSSGIAAAQQLVAAAASDLQAALPVISAKFESVTGPKVIITFGSSIVATSTRLSSLTGTPTGGNSENPAARRPYAQTG